MTADRITDALNLLAGAVETHDGAPADTSLARAQVLATIAVAEQLAKLTQLLAPATATTGGQAEETAPEKPAAPRLMLGDVWSDDSDDEWTVTRQDGRLLLTWGGEPRTWESADSQYGPLRLVQRAGYCHTETTVTAAQVRPGMVVSHPELLGGAPVRIGSISTRAAGVKVQYELLGDPTVSGAVAGGDALPWPVLTLWDEIAGGAR